MKIITTKLDYKINFKELSNSFDFFTFKLSGEDYAKEREEFYSHYNFPVNVTINKVNYFCLPKGTFEKFNTKSYTLCTVTKINELVDDVLLNFIAKLSVSFDKSGRYSLSQNLFYYIENITFSKKIKGARGLELNIKNKTLKVDAANYKIAENKKDLDSLSKRNRFTIEYKDNAPIIRNDFNGLVIKKGFHGKNLGQIDLFNTKAKTRSDLDKTKSGAIYHLINMMNDSGLINIKLKEYSSERFRLKESKFKKELPTIITERISNLGGIYIYSHLNIKNIENSLKDKILSILGNNLNKDLIHIGKPINNRQCGFHIHYPKDYYKENGSNDPYNETSEVNKTVKQSLTVPFGKEEDFINDKKSDLIISKCLVELIIKADFYRKDKPTFSDNTNILGYCCEEGMIYKYSDRNQSINIEEGHDLENINPDIYESLENDEFLVSQNDKLYLINDIKLYAIPDVFKSYDMLSKIEMFSSLSISNENIKEWISELKNEKIKDKLINNLGNYKEIYVLLSKEIKDIFSGITDSETLDSFYERFNSFPKDSIRYAYHGDTVYSHNMDISIMEGKYYTIGKTSNMKELGEFQPIFTCKDIKTGSYKVDMDLIRNLYEHYYIQTNSATKKPYFAKYVREYHKVNI